MVNEHKCYGVPDYPIELEACAHAIGELLMENVILGISSMGDIGKKTLSKMVYNNNSKRFDFACFANNVKGVDI